MSLKGIGHRSMLCGGAWRKRNSPHLICRPTTYLRPCRPRESPLRDIGCGNSKPPGSERYLGNSQDVARPSVGNRQMQKAPAICEAFADGAQPSVACPQMRGLPRQCPSHRLGLALDRSVAVRLRCANSCGCGSLLLSGALSQCGPASCDGRL